MLNFQRERVLLSVVLRLLFQWGVCCLLSCHRARSSFVCRLWELLGQEAQQRPVDCEEETDLHRIAEEVLDEAAQEDGRSGLVVEDG